MEIHEAFDLVAGTSTGGIIAGMLGVLSTDVDKCEVMYDELIPEIFQVCCLLDGAPCYLVTNPPPSAQPNPLGTVKLAMQHAYYDDRHW